MLNADPDRAVCIVEGEKDVHTLMGMGMIATCNSSGAKKWRAEFKSYFHGRKVMIIPDPDTAGEEHAMMVASNLYQIAKSIRIVRLDDDVSDWVAKGGTVGQLGKKYSTAPEWKPDTQSNVVVLNPDAVPEVSDQTALDRIAGGGPSLIQWVHQSDKGAPKNTIENCRCLLASYGINARYNVISKEMDINIPGYTFTEDNARNAASTTIKSFAGEHAFPVSLIDDFVATIADREPFNPVVNWVESKPWDGTPRFDALIDSLDARNPDDARVFLRKWMISAIAGAYEARGVSAQGVLVLQGGQGIGKTTWFKTLVGQNDYLCKEGAILNPSDKDSVKQCVKYWLVELGELDATFRKADISALKSFLTKDSDEFRAAYSRYESKFPRRTVFFGSVNPEQYLHDETGNRRYWTVSCGADMNPHHDVDMQQMWAEVLTWYRSGESWILNAVQTQHVNNINEGFSTSCPLEELLLAKFETSCERRLKLTASEILQKIGYDKPTRGQTREIGIALRKWFGEPKKNNSRRVYEMPEPKIG
jgi:predicted P-loop ATPase